MAHPIFKGERLFMIFLLFSVALNAIAQVVLKFVSQNKFDLKNLLFSPFLYFAGALYVGSIFLWIKGLSLTPLSKAYPLQSLGYLAVFGFSFFIFGEKLNLNQITGLIIICVGVFLIGFYQ